MSGVKVAVYFCTKKYSTRGALGRFDGEVIRVKKHAWEKKLYLREIGCVCWDTPFPKIQHVADIRANKGYIRRERTITRNIT